jgi:hypothetical protein
MKVSSQKRRYLIHIMSTYDERTGTRSYIVRTRRWSTRPTQIVRAAERQFADECELIKVLNPLLPQGSDVRDVLNDVEGPEGFIYLLHLNHTQAASLGCI